MRKRTRAVAVALAAILVTPLPARADTVLDWNATALAAAATQNPFNQARIIAATQLAVFEAVNAIEGGYHPYFGTVVAPAGASSSAAAVTAAHGVLKHFLPGSAAMLDAARVASLAAIPEGSAKAGGIATGEAAAAAMIAARLNDGSSPPAFHSPTSTDAGVWQLTPNCSAAGGAFASWGNLKPFGIENVADFWAPDPPAVTSNLYAKDFAEVKRVGRKVSADRPQDRTDVARFYAGSSPGYIMNLAARQLSVRQGHSIAYNARAFALINMAMSDAFVASFGTKYHYLYWRPETAIHNAALDGNDKTEAEENWEPLITAPCFPGYTSNHAAGSNAGAEMLRRLYGASGHAITITNANFPTLVFQYSQLKQITDDIDDARVYGGIHFRFDQVAGASMAHKVATAVYHGNLQPIDQ